MMSFKNYLVIFTCILYTSKYSCAQKYSKGFYNHTGCLYTYLEGGTFEMITADGDIISEKLELDQINFDSSRSRCIEQNQPGKIVFSFKVDEKSKLKSVAISMKIITSLSEGYWEIPQANLTITRADVDRKRTFPLDVNEIYASLKYSYSCSELVLQTLHRRKQDNDTGRIEPKAIVTLDRFQLQPFQEFEGTVFGPSFDCSVWLTIPLIMGLILVLFIIISTVIGVDFLRKIETNDFKFNKEGLLFTQSQMESNKSR